MLANGKNHRRFETGRKGDVSPLPSANRSDRFPEIVLPGPPVTPQVFLVLQMLLSNRIADLSAIAGTIRSDIALTVQVLRLAAEQNQEHLRGVLDIDELVVHLGLAKLKILLEDTDILSMHPKGIAGIQTFERFCNHARLTAMIAEELASETASVRQEEAYVAGLLRHLGALPFVLGWKIPDLEESDTGETGYQLAKVWRLPSPLVDVISGNRELCAPSTLPLFDVVATADKHAFRLEIGHTFSV
jgi:HD-like signal output (HDOD) protein